MYIYYLKNIYMYYLEVYCGHYDVHIKNEMLKK